MNNINQHTAVKILMPALLAHGAYKSTTYKEPPVEQTPSEALISARLKPFLDQMGIRQDLKIKEQVNLGFAEAIGTNYFTSGDAVIHTAPNLHQIDPEASSFILKHEISHLKHNDSFTACALGLISALTALALTNSYDASRSADITAFAGAIPLVSYKYYCEGKADDFAIANSSIDELKGGRRIFKAMQQLYLESRQKASWKKLLISPQGENLLDALHPSLASRIQKIESHLKIKQGIINEADEQEKIEKLKTLVKEMKQKVLEDFKQQILR
ncbi:MAG: M48 family metalloprotease [Rhabdochlamydiaceae bacterium]|nr:M48 family metalloprotease [Rhabdochlamydiaceae bacterium]